MKAELTIKDKDGQIRRYTFRSWADLCAKIKSGDKIKLLLNQAKMLDGVFDRFEDGNIYIRQDAMSEPTPYSLDTVMGVNKPQSEQ